MRVKLAKIIGVNIYADITVLILVLLISTGTYDLFKANGVLTAIIMSLACSFAVVVSIVAHELAHCHMAHHFGMRVDKIVIFFLGGVAFMKDESQTGWQEIFVGGIGPVFSFALGALMLAICGVAFDVPVGSEILFFSTNPIFALICFAGLVNVLLAVFNMIPAFPMDGGRVLRGVLWIALKDYRRSGLITAITGQCFSGLIILCGLVRMLSSFGGIWFIIIGGIMFWQGRSYYKQMRGIG